MGESKKIYIWLLRIGENRNRFCRCGFLCGVEFDGSDTFGGIATVVALGTLNICGGIHFFFLFASSDQFM